MWKGGIATPSPNTVFLKLPKRVCSSEWLKLGGRLSFFACLIVSARLFFPLDTYYLHNTKLQKIASWDFNASLLMYGEVSLLTLKK